MYTRNTYSHAYPIIDNNLLSFEKFCHESDGLLQDKNYNEAILKLQSALNIKKEAN